jgi:endogenous inhibitor of DNA gyrase (YacG/DUF329 family)
MKKCPICAKPVELKDNPYRPFCSERCKLIDFGNWADGNYRVPSQVERPSVEELEGQVSQDGAEQQ